MNYRKVYDSLIDSAKADNDECYVEEHHITPKCMQGSDDKHNLVLLTACQHYVAHKLLWKIYPDSKPLFDAYFMMSHCRNSNRIYKITSKQYEILKRIKSDNQRIAMTGKKHSKESCDKRSKSLLGHANFKANWVCSNETRKLLSISSKGRIVSDELKDVMSVLRKGEGNPFFGKHHTEEFKLNLSKKLKGRIITDEHRKKLSIAALNRKIN